MKKLLERIKLFFITKYKELIVWIKLFFTTKVVPWMEKNWFEITNLSVLFIVHLMIRNIPDVGFADFIVKMWIMGILTYYVILFVKNLKKGD